MRTLPTSLGAFLQAMVAHPGKVIAGLLLVFVPVCIGLWLTPARYSSEALLFVGVRGSPSSGITPMSDPPLAQKFESVLKLERAMLMSKVLAEEVVQTMGLAFFLGASSDRPSTQELTKSLSVLQRLRRLVRFGPFRLHPDTTQAEKASAILLSGLAVRPLKEGPFLRVTYTSSDPLYAQGVLTEVLETYENRRAGWHGTHAPASHKNDNVRLVGRLERIEEKMQALRAKYGRSSLDDQKSLMVRRIDSLLSEIHRVERAITVLAENGGTVELAPFARGEHEIDPRRTDPLNARMVQEEAELAALEAASARVTERWVKAKEELARLTDLEFQLLKLERQKRMVEAGLDAYLDSNEPQQRETLTKPSSPAVVTLLQSPSLPLASVPPPRLRLLVGALILGLGVGSAWVYLVERYHRVARSASQIEKLVNLPTLAAFPKASLGPLWRLEETSGEEQAKVESARASDTSGDPNSISLEHDVLFQKIVMNLKPSSTSPRMVGFTSAYPREGVTTLAVRFSEKLSAHAQSRVLHVDAHVDSVTAQHLSRIRSTDAATNLRKEAEESVVQVGPYLYVLSAGLVSSSDPLVLTHEQLVRLLEAVKNNNYDYVVFDLPPLSEGLVTPKICVLLDAVVWVIESGRGRGKEMRHFKRVFAEARAPLIGVAITKCPTMLYPSRGSV